MQKKNTKDVETLAYELFNAYSYFTLKKIYNHYLLPIIEKEAATQPWLIKNIHGLHDALSSQTQSNAVGLARNWAVFFTEQVLVDKFIKALPENASRLLNLYLWYPSLYMSIGLADKIVGSDIFKSNYDKNLKNEFALFIIDSSYSYKGSYRTDFYINIPGELRTALKKSSSRPADYELHFEEGHAQTSYEFADQNEIVVMLQQLQKFIELGQLQYTAQKIISQKSLNAASKAFGLKEFFSSESGIKGSTTFLRMAWLLNILQLFEPSHDYQNTDPLQVIKKIFENYTRLLFPAMLLPHMNGLGNNQYLVLQEGVPLNESIVALLKTFTPGAWVNIEHIIRIISYHNYDTASGQYRFYESLTSIPLTHDKFHYNQKSQDINRFEFLFVVTIPMIKAHFFALASLGLIDIAYDNSPDTITLECGRVVNLQKSNPYLGLRYIRLNQIGAYALGLEKSIDINFSTEDSVFVLDHHVLHLSFIGGNSKIKNLIAAKYGFLLSENKYKVNRISFLRDCSNENDVADKIKAFKNEMEQTLPVIWQDFLSEISQKSSPVIIDREHVVFKIGKDPELVRLIATDPELSSRILKAEGYHILIARSDLANVKTRLRNFGYMLQDESHRL